MSKRDTLLPQFWKKNPVSFHIKETKHQSNNSDKII